MAATSSSAKTAAVSTQPIQAMIGQLQLGTEANKQAFQKYFDDLVELIAASKQMFPDSEPELDANEITSRGRVHLIFEGIRFINKSFVERLRAINQTRTEFYLQLSHAHSSWIFGVYWYCKDNTQPPPPSLDSIIELPDYMARDLDKVENRILRQKAHCILKRARLCHNGLAKQQPQTRGVVSIQEFQPLTNPERVLFNVLLKSVMYLDISYLLAVFLNADSINYVRDWSLVIDQRSVIHPPRLLFGLSTDNSPSCTVSTASDITENVKTILGSSIALKRALFGTGGDEQIKQKRNL